MKIKITETQSRGIATITENGEKIGEMTFAIKPDNVIIIDHTDVNPSHRGKNIGKQILDKVVDWAREKNIKIIPVCPFSEVMFRKDEKIQDVLKNK